MSPQGLPDHEEQGRRIRRVAGEARRWTLRAVLLLVTAVVSFSRPGSFFLVLGVALALLAVLAFTLGRRTARAAEAMRRKMALAEAARADAETRGPAGGGQG
ncbi:MAG: hypothetical protein HY705_05040 [Gemmatimonadetes bacterium]|nr:hypothetical protein [Gemmatimonadota bacterium]